MRKRKHRKRSASKLLIVAALLLVLAPGCGRRLRYTFNTDGEVIYRVTLKKDVIGQGRPDFSTGLGGDFFYTLEPLGNYGEGIKIRAGLRPENAGKDLVIKTDFGTDSFIVTPNGIIKERYGALAQVDWTVLIFKLPDHRVRVGDTWSWKNKKRFANITPDVKYVFKLDGYEKRQGRRCARIKVSVDYTYNAVSDIPGGVRLGVSGKMDYKGTVYFSPRLGAPVEASYVEKSRRLLTNEMTGQVLRDANDLSEMTIRLEPQK